MQALRERASRNARFCKIVDHRADQLMLSLQTEEDRPTFRPFTRESLAQIEARIQEDKEKKRELEKKRAEGEVSPTYEPISQ